MQCQQDILVMMGQLVSRRSKREFFVLADNKTLQQDPKTLEKISQNRKEEMKVKLDWNLDVRDPSCGRGWDDLSLEGCGPESWGRLGVGVLIMWPFSAEVSNGWLHLVFYDAMLASG